MYKPSCSTKVSKSVIGIKCLLIIIHVYKYGLTQFRLDNAITHIAASDIVNAPVVIVI